MLLLSDAVVADKEDFGEVRLLLLLLLLRLAVVETAAADEVGIAVDLAARFELDRTEDEETPLLPVMFPDARRCPETDEDAVLLLLPTAFVRE